MNKQELIAAIAEQNDISKAVAESALNTISGVVTDELAAGNEITLPGLGKLRTRKVAARTGRNPKTGETLTIEARTAVKFSAAKALKDAVA